MFSDKDENVMPAKYTSWKDVNLGLWLDNHVVVFKSGGKSNPIILIQG